MPRRRLPSRIALVARTQMLLGGGLFLVVPMVHRYLSGEDWRAAFMVIGLPVLAGALLVSGMSVLFLKQSGQRVTVLSQTIILLSVGCVMAAASHAGLELILRQDRFSIIGYVGFALFALPSLIAGLSSLYLIRRLTFNI